MDGSGTAYARGDALLAEVGACSRAGGGVVATGAHLGCCMGSIVSEKAASELSL